MLRHNVPQIKGICFKLLSPLNENELKEVSGNIDLQNCSSANSTPINCKSIPSSVQNSTLKKRNYQEYNQTIKHEIEDI